MLLVGPPILKECITPKTPSTPPLSSRKPAFTTPLNPCTTFFFSVTPVTPPENLLNMLEKAWEYDPLTTLRLVNYLRILKGGKRFYNEGFHVCALWLYENHPFTLACNLREFAKSGCLGDFAEVLYRLVNGKDCNFTTNDSTEVARRGVSRYVEDSTYRFFHERVSDVFADLLKSDVKFLGLGDVDLLSYASVGCPSVDSLIDRHTLLCESIAKKVFPQELDPSYVEIRDDHYVYRVRNRLRKEVLGPLRMALQERSPGKLGRSQDYTLGFMKKAYERLMKLKGRAKKPNFYQIILAMILKGNSQCFPSTPDSVIASLKDDNIEEIELEWKDLVKGFSQEGTLKNSLAVCDVSDDMGETTINVSVSMGLLISDLSNDTWKGTLYGFNQSPKLCKIEGGDLCSKVNFIKQMNCSDRVDIEAILNQILEVGVTRKLKSEKMVERVFVFTNKEFMKGAKQCWGWNYRAVWENYEKAGFDRVPEVVFWNIKGISHSPPLISEVFHNRLTIINGFSRSLFTFFLDENAVCRSDEIKSVSTAEDVMRITLSGKEYQNLVVLD